jgi:hypothetical protein
LRNLAKEFEIGEIYVTNTSKLLNYHTNHKYLNWSYEIKDNEVTINIHSIEDPIFGSHKPTVADLQGISFYELFTTKTRVFISNIEL